MNRRTQPLALVLAVLALLLVAVPASATTISISGTGTPAANGSNLLTALAGAGPSTLIKLGPGTFDLSGQQVVMKDLVDIEGSGRDLTFIVSDTSISLSPDVVLAPGGIEAELRELTVRNTAVAGTARGVRILTSELLLTEVSVEVQQADTSIGITNSGSSPRVDRVLVRAAGADQAIAFNLGSGGPVVTNSLGFVFSPGSSNTGISINNGSRAIVDDVVLFALAGSFNSALSVGNGSDVEIINVRGTAQNGDARGLFINQDSIADVKECTFVAESDDRATALLLSLDARAEVAHSNFRANPINIDHKNVIAIDLYDNSRLQANQSNFDSTNLAVRTGSLAAGSFGTSQLVGSVISGGLGNLRCIFSYNGSFTARNASCL